MEAGWEVQHWVSDMECLTVVTGSGGKLTLGAGTRLQVNLGRYKEL
jgi:hypothetical protein